MIFARLVVFAHTINAEHGDFERSAFSLRLERGSKDVDALYVRTLRRASSSALRTAASTRPKAPSFVPTRIADGRTEGVGDVHCRVFRNEGLFDFCKAWC